MTMFIQDVLFCSLGGVLVQFCVWLIGVRLIWSVGCFIGYCVVLLVGCWVLRFCC